MCKGARKVKPNLFISTTADRPKRDSPPCTGPTLEVELSAKALLQTCVSVHYNESEPAPLLSSNDFTNISNAQAVKSSNYPNAIASHM